MEIFENSPNKYALIKQILKLLSIVNHSDTKFSDEIRHQLNFRMLEMCEKLMPPDIDETANDYHRRKNKGYEMVHSKLKFTKKSRVFKIKFFHADTVVNNFIAKAIVQLDMENGDNFHSLYQIFSNEAFKYLCKISSDNASLNELVVYKKIEANDYSRKRRRLILKDCNVLFDFDNFEEFYLTGKTTDYETNIHIEQKIEETEANERTKEEKEQPQEAKVIADEPEPEPEIEPEIQFRDIGIEMADDGFYDFEDLMYTPDDSMDDFNFLRTFHDVSNKNFYDISVREYLQCYQYDYSEESKEAERNDTIHSLSSGICSANMSAETSDNFQSIDTNTNTNENSRFSEMIGDLDLNHSNDFDALLDYFSDSNSLESQMFELNLI